MPKWGYVVIVVFVLYVGFLFGRLTAPELVRLVEVEKEVQVTIPCPPVAVVPSPPGVVKHKTHPTVTKAKYKSYKSARIDDVQSP